MRFSRLFLSAAILATLVLSGCASSPMRSYDSELKQTAGSMATNNIGQALADHEKSNSGDKDLLYFLEKGNLLRLNGQFPESRDAWLLADEKVRAWEEEAKLNPDKILSYIGSAIVNDKMLRYDGQDFEKVLLSTNLALDHILLGNWGDARTEIKKMHEREAIIADIRAKEIEKVEEEAKSRDVKTEFKDLKGYPVETLNDPEVSKLKNSYQSAFGHYLAGFVYETLNEPSLAAPGYRKAIELRPGIKVLEDGLSNLDKRTGGRIGKTNLTDVLFVVESGSAPARQSVSFPIPIPSRNGMVLVPVSFPVIKSHRFTPPAALTLNSGAKLALTSVSNLDAMSRRALKDDMPGIILRSTIRTITKSVAQDQAQRVGGGLLGAVVSIAAVVTESADERGWRTLPADISIARAQLPAGKHAVTVAGNKLEIEIGGRYAVFPIRVIGSAAYVAQPDLKKLAALPEPVAESAVPPPAPTTQAKEKTRAGKKKAASGKKSQTTVK